MSANESSKSRLGIYFGIFTSGFISLVLMLALFEQLGMEQRWLAQIMLLAPLVLAGVLAVATRTLDRRVYHTAGRRVPPVAGGLAVAAIVVGGIGYFAGTGAVFFLGFDGLPIVLGWTLGLFAAAILFLPYLRKAGAYTLPGYFGARFEWPELRWIAALCLLPPLWLLFVAELKVAAATMSLFLNMSYETALLVIGSIVAATVALGGLRAVTWTSSTQAIIAILGFGVPAAIAAVLVTNLPIPQLTYAELFDRIASFEAILATPGSVAGALPGAAPQTVTFPFLTPFLSLSTGQFIALMLSIAMGIAALPSLVTRAGTTRTVYDQRRAAAWAVLIVALFAATVPAYAAFTRFGMMQELSMAAAETPEWVEDLEAARLATANDADADGTVAPTEIRVARDGVTLALPVMSGFPYVLVLLVAAAGIAIAMAAAAAHLFTMASASAEDLYTVLADPAASSGRKLLMARLAALAGAAMAMAFLTAFDIDILRAACWALSLAAATFFPVLLLSIWWTRFTTLGALGAMLTGAIFTGTVIVAAETLGNGSFLGIESLIAGVFGAPLSFAAGIGLSLASRAPAPAQQLFVEDMRHPGGESLFDRATRRATRTA